MVLIVRHKEPGDSYSSFTDRNIAQSEFSSLTVRCYKLIAILTEEITVSWSIHVLPRNEKDAI